MKRKIAIEVATVNISYVFCFSQLESDQIIFIYVSLLIFIM
jgi:hypothetical protein